jgi:hypothetical protein
MEDQNNNREKNREENGVMHTISETFVNALDTVTDDEPISYEQSERNNKKRG